MADRDELQKKLQKSKEEVPEDLFQVFSAVLKISFEPEMKNMQGKKPIVSSYLSLLFKCLIFRIFT